tara:strand:+ start:471 stop:638 length:168 start_codon:yes stop_codon:yes gene_type:complete
LPHSLHYDVAEILLGLGQKQCWWLSRSLKLRDIKGFILVLINDPDLGAVEIIEDY